MRLFVAEKPSVGREISKYLPGTGQVRDGYIVHGDDVVTWAFGHVLQQAEPGDYDERYTKWNAGDLPIVPQEWKLNVSKSGEKQFRIIQKLLAEADSVVHAGDPDREGQLLIDEILVEVGYQKPVARCLIQALDEKSMRKALADLRNNTEFHNLYLSALARARADWLIGMNLSRAYTIAARRAGHKVTLPIGRVKTPTLALVVRREEELAAFTPVQYYTIHGVYAHPNGTFRAQWKPQDTQAGLDSEDRLLDRNIAETISKTLQSNPEAFITSCEKKKKKDPQRLPLSLSALQVLAGKAFGYDPQQVLEAAQGLYEKKFTTYPRSDCDYLPESQWKDASTIVQNLLHCKDEAIAGWAAAADTTIRSRAWNDKQITAHHAIIPTTVMCPVDRLSKRERDIYHLIAQAYLAQFYPIHEYEQTKITLDHGGETFIANGRVVTELGWKAVYQKVRKADSDAEATEEDIDDGELPAVKKGDTVVAQQFTIGDKTTKPPSRFTPSTLLQAMKEIHKYVKEDSTKKQLKDVSGIGTEATRATIIQDLIDRGFMVTEGKKHILKPTQNAYLLIHALPDELSYPDATAFWEERLARMSKGEDTLESFLSDQVAFLTGLVRKSLGPVSTPVAAGEEKVCPSCGKGMLRARTGRFGTFLGCSDYPSCTYTENVGVDGKSQGPRPQRSVDAFVARENPSDLPLPTTEPKYKCPRCQKGYFVKQGKRWVCHQRSRCRTQCADVEGVPSIYKG